MATDSEELVDEYVANLHLDRRSVYLVKVPAWLGERILSCSPGTELGESTGLGPGQVCQFIANASLTEGKPDTFQLNISQAISPSTTFAIGASSPAVALSLRQAYHALPTRSESYKKMTKERAALAASSNVDRRTIEDDRDALTASRPNVQMFKLGSSQETQQPEGSPSTKRARVSTTLPSLPHLNRAVANSSERPDTDELIMRILVGEDQGWNLQTFSKRFKDAGGMGLNQAQIKTKLVDVCDFVRRGEDPQPRYYLKAEFK